MGEDGGHVGSDKILVVAGAHHEWRLIASRHNLLRVGTGDHSQCERSAQFLNGLADGLFEIAIQVALHQVGHHFGVGLGIEDVAFRLQAVLQFQIVFDDAVVHHHHVAVAIAMGMGVLFGGPAVGRPASVPDAERAIDGAEADGVFQVAQLTFGAPDVELTVVAINRDAGRVVPAIFQPLEAFQDDRNGSPSAYVTDNSAHATIMA